MPKPVKKAAPKKPAAKKATKRPSADPARRASQLRTEHEAKMQQGKWATPEPDVTPPHGDPFEAQFKARMAELGRKGGKASGAKRMSNLTAEQRSEIARKGAAGKWAKANKSR